MHHKIKSETLLFNYFFYHPEDFLDTQKLGRIKEDLFKHVRCLLYVDIRDDSIVASVEYSPLFQWDPKDNKRIIRAQGSDQYYTERSLKAINSDLPPEIISALEKACKESH